MTNKDTVDFYWFDDIIDEAVANGETSLEDAEVSDLIKNVSFGDAAVTMFTVDHECFSDYPILRKVMKEKGKNALFAVEG